MAKINLAELEIDVDLMEVSDKTAAEYARGVQVQAYKEKYGPDAVLSRTTVFNSPQLREQVERELMHRDRLLTLRRWEKEGKIKLKPDEDDPLTMCVVYVGDVQFREHRRYFPSLKLMADVSLALMCVPHGKG